MKTTSTNWELIASQVGPDIRMEGGDSECEDQGLASSLSRLCLVTLTVLGGRNLFSWRFQLWDSQTFAFESDNDRTAHGLWALFGPPWKSSGFQMSALYPRDVCHMLWQCPPPGSALRVISFRTGREMFSSLWKNFQRDVKGFEMVVDREVS